MRREKRKTTKTTTEAKKKGKLLRSGREVEHTFQTESRFVTSTTPRKTFSFSSREMRERLQIRSVKTKNNNTLSFALDSGFFFFFFFYNPPTVCVEEKGKKRGL